MLVKPGQLLRALQNHVSASLKSGKEENRPRFWQQKSATPPPNGTAAEETTPATRGLLPKRSEMRLVFYGLHIVLFAAM